MISFSFARTCRAWNDVETVNRTTFLTVNVAPSWQVEPHNGHVVLGRSIALHCSASGHPQPRVLWKKSVATSASGSVDSPPGLMTMVRGVELFADQAEVVDRKEVANDDDGQGSSSSHPSEYQEVLSTYRRQVHANGTLHLAEVEKIDGGFYMCQVWVS